MAKPDAQGAGSSFARSPAPAWPAVRDRAFTVIPLAYYAIALRHAPEISFAAFWWKMVTNGPWPSGPIWFVWVLFAFDLIASLLHRLSPRLIDPINRLSLHGASTGPRCSSCLCLRSPQSSTFPALVHLRTKLAGSSLGRSRSRPAACCFMRATSSSAPASALREYRSRRAERRTDGWRRSSWDWMVLTLVPYCLLWG